MLGFLSKAGVASAAGNGDHARVTRKAQPCATPGTAKVLVLFAVLKPYFCLAALGAFALLQSQIATVLGAAFFVLPREHAVDAKDISCKPQRAEKHAEQRPNDRALNGTENGTQQVTTKAAPKQRHGELICTVATVHKGTQRLLDLFPKGHGKTSFHLAKVVSAASAKTTAVAKQIDQTQRQAGIAAYIGAKAALRASGTIGVPRGAEL